MHSHATRTLRLQEVRQACLRSPRNPSRGVSIADKGADQRRDAGSFSWFWFPTHFVQEMGGSYAANDQVERSHTLPLRT